MSWQTPTELPDLDNVDSRLVAIDIETNDPGLREDRGSSWPWHEGWICGISLAWRAGGTMHATYLPIRHPATNNLDCNRVFGWLQDRITSGTRFITQNGAYDWAWMQSDGGITMPLAEQIEEIGALAALVDENQFQYSLEALCQRHGLPGKDTALLEEACKAAGFKITRQTPVQSYIWQLSAEVSAPYAEVDAIRTYELYELLIKIIEKEGTREQYRLECALSPMTIAMRRRGIRIDLSAAEQARDHFLAKRDTALKALSEQHGSRIGMDEINGRKWKAATFGQYGITSPRTTATGAPSFAAGKSGWMGTHEHWLPQLIATANRYDAAACKFLQGHIIDHIIGGRIFAEIHQFKAEDGGTKSLRFSVSNPPLQQMPIRDEEIGPLIRKVFLSEEGHRWAKPDVSQQEFRMLVHFAEQHNLTGAREAGDEYRNNQDADFHRFVSEISGLPRQDAKPTNFMKIYGGGAGIIALKTGKTLEQALEIMKIYDDKLPFVNRLSRICMREAERGGITTLYGGAKRHWNKYEAGRRDGNKKDSGPCSHEEALLRCADPEHAWYRQEIRRAKLYTALNALIQGSSAVHTKRWMLACWREGITPLLQLHDALESSVATREEGEMIARLGEEAIKLSVPMRVDLKFGNNWADATHGWDEVSDCFPCNGSKHSIQMPAVEPAICVDIERDSKPSILSYDTNSNGHDAGSRPDSENNELFETVDHDPAAGHAIESHQIWITQFPNVKAQSLRHGYSTLPKIAAGIRTTTAATKEALPMLKLQRFDGKRTDKNCLRSDDSVVEIHGIEGEHDKGTLAFTEAVERLRNANLRCIVYTSPGYVAGTRERWRVLLSLSQPLAPSFRTGLVARLNGIVDGVLAPTESFTLSQSFYYGSVDNNPDHQVVMLDGDFIDQRQDLAAGAIFEDGSKAGNPTAPHSHANSQASGERQPSEPWADLVVKILAGDILHPNLVVLSAKLVTAGMDPAAVENLLRGLMDKSAAVKDQRWQERYDDIPRIVRSAEAKFSPTPAVDISMLATHLKGLGGPAPETAGPGEPAPAPDPGEPPPPPGDVASPKIVLGKKVGDVGKPLLDLSALGFFPNSQSGGTAGGTGTGAGSSNAKGSSTGTALGTPPLIDARPFVLRDPKTLLKRQWVYGTQLIRKFGSATFAPSGSGKSSLFIAEALAMATGKPLLGITPPARIKVWYWNGEDPYDELERRVGAACLHYGISAGELDGWLFVNSGRDPNSAVVIAKQERDGTTIAIPVVEALVATIHTNKIDVVMIDPFISSHQVPENDNNAIDIVAKTWTMIADITNTAIDLAHHTRKTGGAEVTVEDGRGASALLSAVRPARVLNVMTEDEALKGGVADGRRRYFKVEDGKNNLALPPDKVDWYRSESVYLGNGAPGDPDDMGDDMGVVTAWEWPTPAAVSPEELEKVKAAIQAGQWRKHSTAADWVGHAVAKALGLGDVRKKGLDRTKVTTMVNTWLYKEVLKVVEREDEHRHLKEFVEVA